MKATVFVRKNYAAQFPEDRIRIPNSSVKLQNWTNIDGGSPLQNVLMMRVETTRRSTILLLSSSFFRWKLAQFSQVNESWLLVDMEATTQSEKMRDNGLQPQNNALERQQHSASPTVAITHSESSQLILCAFRYCKTCFYDMQR
jgi:hypothetical protein